MFASTSPHFTRYFNQKMQLSAGLEYRFRVMCNQLILHHSFFVAEIPLSATFCVYVMSWFTCTSVRMEHVKLVA